jgi:hypothetical protein
MMRAISSIRRIEKTHKTLRVLVVACLLQSTCRDAAVADLVKHRFARADTDHDGTLDAREFQTPAGQELLKLVC